MAESGLITILFTDLVGSTALSQQLGNQAADRVRRDHFEHLRRAVHTTNGTEVKTIGDAMMVSYHSASDAIAGAVAMQQNVHAHNAEASVPIEMRIGISAGDASFEDGDWFGTPVVEASRLCGAAAGAQILVTDIVRVLGGSRVTHELTSVGAIEGKGLSAPMAACEVVWEPTSTDPFGRLELPLPPLVDQADTFSFVGRDEPWEKLWLAWKSVTVTGRQAVFVAGEPGIGKTRLVKELCREAHDSDGIVLWGTCDEELAIPYQPFVETLRWLSSSAPPDVLADLVGPTGGELTPLVPDLSQLVPGLDRRLTDDPETERHRLFEAVTNVVRNLSSRKPVVLVLDDVHWARRPTLLLLRHLLRSPAPMNLLIVATYRDTDLDRTHPLSEMLADLRRQGGVNRLALRGLDGAGVVRFLTRTAGHDLDERGIQLAEAIALETEGNPFFIGEVLRHLAESGALVQRDGRWDSDLLASAGRPGAGDRQPAEPHLHPQASRGDPHLTRRVPRRSPNRRPPSGVRPSRVASNAARSREVTSVQLGVGFRTGATLCEGSADDVPGDTDLIEGARDRETGAQRRSAGLVARHGTHRTERAASAGAAVVSRPG